MFVRFFFSCLSSVSVIISLMFYLFSFFFSLREVLQRRRGAAERNGSSFLSLSYTSITSASDYNFKKKKKPYTYTLIILLLLFMIELMVFGRGKKNTYSSESGSLNKRPVKKKMMTAYYHELY